MKIRNIRIMSFLLVFLLMFTTVISGCSSTESGESINESGVDISDVVSRDSSASDTESGESSIEDSSDESIDDSSSANESDKDDSSSDESKPDTSKPDTSKPDDSEPDVSEPDVSTPVEPEPVEPTDIEKLGGYENVNLTYTFNYANSNMGRHSQSDFMPYVAYLDKNGNIQDYFFDSYLFLPRTGFGPSGASMHANLSNPTKAIDWTAYVNDTFASGYNVSALNSAFGKVKTTLGDSDKNAGVFFTILYPSKTATSFGTLGGRSLNFSKIEDRKYAIKWMIDEQIQKFQSSNCENLELVGFYWLEEYLVDSGDDVLLKYASDYLHSKGLTFIWIPWYEADGYKRHKQLGFDVTCMQPNLFFLGYTDPNRVTTSAQLSNKYNMCMEMELDYNVSKPYYYNRYLYYLEGGMKTGMMEKVKMYYQDTAVGVYYDACYSKDSLFRSVYDLTYKYAKGTLTQSDINYHRPAGQDDNFVKDIEFDKILNGADWISIGKTYTGCKSYTDGNGMGYQNVSGNELTDGKIAKTELSTDWFAFHNSIRDREGRFSITIDLGKVTSGISHFAAHFDNKHKYAIGSPLDIKIYTSTDGVNFKYYGTPELVLDPNYSAFYLNGSDVSARYVKLSIGRSDKAYIFCSEFLVGVDK